MRIDKSSSILLLAAFLTVNAQQIKITTRSSPFCGLLKQKIYCYGGEVHEDQVIPDSTLYALDVNQVNGARVGTLGNYWQVINPNTAGVNTEERGSCQYATIGGARLVLSGCYNCISKGSRISDQTIAYDAENNTWSKYANYMEDPYGNRQIYQASTAQVPLKGIAFYGGIEEHINTSWSIPTNQNISATQFNKTFRAVGYTSLTYLNIDNTSNPWTVPFQTNIPSFFPALQTSIYDPISKMIFFFGGQIHDTLVPGYSPTGPINWYPFSIALTFNTETGVWANQSLRGDVIPTNRKLHSTTLLPNGEYTVLLYGGEGLYATSNDYCFTLDLRTFVWTQHNIQAPSIDLRRSKHSAVLVNNDSLFIIHGIASASTSATAPVVLNISNPLVISYMERYVDPTVPLMINDDNANGLSTGALAGIVVGACVIGFLVIGLVFYKRRVNKKKEAAKQKPPSNINSQEPIEVDWDEIEKRYSEVPSTNLISTSPLPLTDAIVFSSIKKSEHEITPVTPTAIVPSSPVIHDDETSTAVESIERLSANLLNNNIRIASPPDAIDETAPIPGIVKPDVSDSSYN